MSVRPPTAPSDPSPTAAPRPSAGAMVSGSTVTLVGKVTAAALGFAASVLSARVLGDEGFGLFSLALATVTFAGVFAAFGLDKQLLAVLPAALQRGRKAAGEVLGAALRFSLGVSVVLVIVLAVGGAVVAGAMDKPELSEYLVIVGLSIPFTAALALLRSASQSVYAFSAAVAPQFIVQPVLMVAAFAVGGALGMDGVAVAALYVAAVAASAVAAVWMVVRQGSFGRSWLRPWGSVRSETARAAGPFLFIHLFTNLKTTVLLFVAGPLLAAAEIGYFSAAQRTAGLVSFILVAMNMVFAPLIATLWTEGDLEALGDIYKTTTRWTMAVSLPLCILLACAAPGVLALFGPGFQAAALALAVLAAGQFINAATGSVGYLLMLTGNERTMLWNTIGATVASAVAGVVLGRMFGLNGIAVAGGLVVAGFNVALLVQVWRALGLLPFGRGLGGVAAAGVASAGAGALLYSWAWSGAIPVLVALVAVSAAVLGVYTVVFLALGLTPEDRAFVSTHGRRVLGRLNPS